MMMMMMKATEQKKTKIETREGDRENETPTQKIYITYKSQEACAHIKFRGKYYYAFKCNTLNITYISVCACVYFILHIINFRRNPFDSSIKILLFAYDVYV